MVVSWNGALASTLTVPPPLSASPSPLSASPSPPHPKSKSRNIRRCHEYGWRQYTHHSDSLFYILFSTIVLLFSSLFFCSFSGDVVCFLARHKDFEFTRPRGCVGHVPNGRLSHRSIRDCVSRHNGVYWERQICILSTRAGMSLLCGWMCKNQNNFPVKTIHK